MYRDGYDYGQCSSSQLGLDYYKSRFYSPTLGRFMQTDPAGYGDGINWYAYTHNDPVNGSDPTGLVTITGQVPGLTPTAPPSSPNLGPPIVVIGTRLPSAFGSTPGAGGASVFSCVTGGCDIPITGSGPGFIEIDPSAEIARQTAAGSPKINPPNAVNRKSPNACAYMSASGHCAYVRDKNGNLQLDPEWQVHACKNYDAMMKSNAQVGAIANGTTIAGTANAATGGALGVLSRASAMAASAGVAFISGVASSVTSLLGLASPPQGCK